MFIKLSNGRYICTNFVNTTDNITQAGEFESIDAGNKWFFITRPDGSNNVLCFYGGSFVFANPSEVSASANTAPVKVCCCIQQATQIIGGKNTSIDYLYLYLLLPTPEFAYLYFINNVVTIMSATGSNIVATGVSLLTTNDSVKNVVYSNTASVPKQQINAQPKKGFWGR